MSAIKYSAIAFVLIAVILAAIFYRHTNWLNSNIIFNRPNMNLSSAAFGNNQLIPEKYTCQGAGINPPIDIADVPAEAKSLVLIVDDPDATSGTFTHWMVWNIDPATQTIEEGKVPAGAIEGNTSIGRPGYVGPCPPSGTHRYFFKLFAIDIILSIGADSSVDKLESEMAGHVISQGQLIGLYQKK